MKLDEMYISGVGVYLPEPVSVKDAVAEGLCAPETAELGWQGTRVAGDMPAPDMAIEASRQAIARSGMDAEDIHLLLHASVSHQGPEGWSPHHYIQRHTIGGNVPAIGVRQGCDGMLAAMELAVSYLSMDPARTTALVTAADNFSAPLFDRWRCHTGVVYSDIGSAVVLSRQPGFAKVSAITSVSLPELEELGRGTEALFPPGVTVGRPVDFEARMADYPEEVVGEAFRLVGAALAKTVANTLEEAGLGLGDVTRVTHPAPGSDLIMKMMYAPIGIDPDIGIVRFGAENGKSGASDQIAGLNHLVETGQVGPGDHVLLLGSGPGMCISCVVVEILERPSWSDAS